MARYLQTSILIFTAVVIIHSCKKSEDLPPVPEIKYKDFIKYKKDSAVMIISFRDGDGDIGLDEKDTLPPYNPKSAYYNNFFMIYYYKNKSGVYTVYDLDSTTKVIDTVKYAYRIPNITPIGQNKLLDGDIRIKMKAPYYVPGHKSIRYDIFIFDRAKNKSNVVTSAEISIP